MFDSIQSDVMQVNKGIKEFLMESKSHNSPLPEIENIHYSFLLLYFGYTVTWLSA